jgi:hypothetical protein
VKSRHTPVITLFILLPFVVGRADEGVVIHENRVLYKDLISGEVIKHEFLLENRTDAPVSITEIHSDCGCIMALSDKLPTTTYPKGTFVIPIKIDTAGKDKSTTESVTIVTDKRDMIKAYVQLEFLDVLRPRSLGFDSVEKNALSEEKEFAVALPARMLISREHPLSCDDAAISWRPIRKNLSKGSNEYAFGVRIDGKKAMVGKHAAKIEVCLDEKNAKISLPVRYEIIGDYTYQPSKISFGIMKKGEAKTAEFQLISRKSFTELYIKSTHVPDPLLIQPKFPNRITFVFRSEDLPAGKYESMITLLLSNGDKIEIPVYAYILPEAK